MAPSSFGQEPAVQTGAQVGWIPSDEPWSKLLKHLESQWSKTVYCYGLLWGMEACYLGSLAFQANIAERSCGILIQGLLGFMCGVLTIAQMSFQQRGLAAMKSSQHGAEFIDTLRRVDGARPRLEQ